MILSNTAGKPLDRTKFYPRFKRVLQEAGLPDINRP